MELLTITTQLHVYHAAMHTKRLSPKAQCFQPNSNDNNDNDNNDNDDGDDDDDDDDVYTTVDYSNKSQI
ncbi:hypothetical protein DOY81_013146 [Sarcophaga bullata]|nr:hypothetical protein DOY81_013146 [Sarcophaga bullata]